MSGQAVAKDIVSTTSSHNVLRIGLHALKRIYMHSLPNCML